MELRIYGASDDLVEVEGVLEDEHNVYIDGEIPARFEVQVRGHRKFRVAARYDGCWNFAVEQLDEGYDLPEFDFSTRQHPRPDRSEGSYSTMLVVGLPEGIASEDVKMRRLG